MDDIQNGASDQTVSTPFPGPIDPVPASETTAPSSPLTPGIEQPPAPPASEYPQAVHSWKKPKKSLSFISVIIFLILAGGIAATFFLSQTNSDVRSRAASVTPTPMPALCSAISLDPDTGAISPGQTIKTTISASGNADEFWVFAFNNNNTQKPVCVFSKIEQAPYGQNLCPEVNGKPTYHLGYTFDPVVATNSATIITEYANLFGQGDQNNSNNQLINAQLIGYVITGNEWSIANPNCTKNAIAVIPAPIPGAPTCSNYKKNIYINECDYDSFIAFPRGSKCFTDSTDVTIYNSATDYPTEMRYMNQPNYDIYCNAVSLNDPGWSTLEPYGSTKKWEVPAGDGVKKVCAQFKNASGDGVPCGASIELLTSPAATPTTTPTTPVTQTPTSTLTPTLSPTPTGGYGGFPSPTTSPTNTPTVTPTLPSRPNLCSGALITPSTLEPNQSLTITSESVSDADSFWYMAYNKDFTNDPNNPSDYTPVCVLPDVNGKFGDNTYADPVSCPKVNEGIQTGHLGFKDTATNLRTTGSKVIPYNDIFRLDRKHNTQALNVQLNAYFQIGTGPWSMPDANCAPSVTGVRLTPTPGAPACTSWTTTKLNSCDMDGYLASPRSSNCYTSSQQVAITVNAPDATEMRFLNEADIEVFCYTIPPTDLRWSAWEPRAVTKSWILPSGTGDRKVCSQYKNTNGESIPCGASIVLQSGTGNTNLTLKLNFQGSSASKANIPVTVTLKQGTTDVYSQTIPSSSDTNGIVTTIATGVQSGTYDVYVKGWAHIRRRISGITINAGDNTLDLTQILLLAGDVMNDNVINSLDIGKIMEDYTPTTPPNSPADINLDGTVNALDLGYVLENYFMTGE